MKILCFPDSFLLTDGDFDYLSTNSKIDSSSINELIEKLFDRRDLGEKLANSLEYNFAETINRLFDLDRKELACAVLAGRDIENVKYLTLVARFIPFEGSEVELSNYKIITNQETAQARRRKKVKVDFKIKAKCQIPGKCEVEGGVSVGVEF